MNLYKALQRIIDTRQSRELITKWCKKAGREDRAEGIIKFIESRYKETNEQLAAANWLIQTGSDDYNKTKQALYICKQKKLDPLKQSINDLISKFPDIKPKEQPLDPDLFLSDKKDEGNGIVSYSANDADMPILRKIINTHWGKDANPWCLLQGNGDGELTSSAKDMWEHYSAYPKRVAFRNGKLLAFSAGIDKDMREWWDRFDRSFPFIPYEGKTWEGHRSGEVYTIGPKGRVFRETESTIAKLQEEYAPNIEDTSPSVEIDKQNKTLRVGHILYSYEEKDGKYIATKVYYGEGTEVVPFNKNLEIDGIRRFYYKNGQLRSESSYKNNLLNGVTKEYFEDGTLRTRFMAKGGYKDGICEEFYPDGSIQSKETFVQGNSYGPYVDYYENGQLHHKFTRKNGKFDGLYEKYSENGNPIARITFKEGEWNGPCEEYYENGQLKIKSTYENGLTVGPQISFYENGNIKKECSFNENGAWDGKVVSYNEDGSLAGRATYKDGKPEGRMEIYYKNGQLRTEHIYKDGQLDGPYAYYYDDGQLRSKGTFIQGHENGRYETYFPNGQIEAKGLYKNGKQEGRWEEYNANGSLRGTRFYKDGKEVEQ